jgi:hypothetical protein
MDYFTTLSVVAGATTAESTATAVVSAATAAESVVVASVEAPPQATNVVAIANTKSTFFIFFCFMFV